jgi:hypothetical protein
MGVIVMGVGEENGSHDGHMVNPILSGHLLSQADDACASVNDDEMSTDPHLQAGGVAADAVRAWPRHRVATAYSPELDAE